MKLGYKEEAYRFDLKHVKTGIYLEKNVLYIFPTNEEYLVEEFNDFIDIKKIVKELRVDNSLEEIYIYGNQEQILNSDDLQEFTNLKIIHIRNVELTSLDWLVSLSQVESFTLSSTLGYEKGVMQDDFYHPIKYLQNLTYLDLSFSRFSEDAVYLSDNESLFDEMHSLQYLNVRETNFCSTSFLSLLKGKDLVLNFIDNSVKLDFSEYDYIRLITIITAYKDGSYTDISRYLGS